MGLKPTAERQRPALLRVLKDSVRLQDVVLMRGRYVIGRNPSAEIFLDDSRVSRPHAEIVCGPFGRWWIHDLGSTNGVRVGGEETKQRMLRHLDRISIGDFILEFRQSPRELSLDSEENATTVSSDTIQIAAVPSSSRARITPAHLAAIKELGAELLATGDAKERLDILTRAFVDAALPADAASAMRVREDGSTLVLAGPFRRADELEAEGPYCSTTVIEAIRATRSTVVASNTALFEGVSKSLSISATERPVAIVAVPIHATESYVDVLYLEVSWGYATPQWQALIELAAGSYVQARLVSQANQDLRGAAKVERDLEMAHELQSRLLPDCIKVTELDVAVGYEPSHWVGGDYVDVLPLGDGRLLLVIADVCGKGLSAALVSSSVHTMIHALTDTVVDVERLMDRLNQYLCAHLPESSFVTLTAITIDTGSGDLECLNAGHPAALVASTDGSFRWLQSECNVALGMLHDAKFVVQRTRLEPDETLLLFTDGAYESFGLDQRSVGPAEIAERLAKQRFADPRAKAEDLSLWFSQLLSDRRGAQLRSDDTTWLVARHRPTPP